MIARVLSWVFVPTMMPLYGAILAFTLSILTFVPVASKVVFLLIIAIITIAAPLSIFLLLQKLGYVTDAGLNKQKERPIPYVICILALAGTAWFLWTKHAPDWLVMFYVGGIVAGIIELVVNFWWKISVHAAGIAGIVALLLRMVQSGLCLPATMGWLIASIALAGLIGAARLWMHRHTLGQVMAGYLVGFICVYALML